MTQDKTASRPATLARRRTVIGLTLATVLGLCVLALVWLPSRIARAVEDWLLSQGVQQAQVQDVDFNPFSGEFTLKGLRVDADDRRVLELPRLALRFSWLLLAYKQAYSAYLVIEGADLTVQGLADGSWRVAGLGPGRESADTAAGAPSDWRFGVERIELRDSRIRVLTPELDTTLDIDHAHLDHLASWDAQRPAPLRFRGALAGSRLELDGDLHAFGGEPRADLHLKLDGLDLAPFAAVSGNQRLQGTLALDTGLKLDLGSDGTMHLGQQGDLALAAVEVARNGQALRQRRLAWIGRLDLTRPPGAAGPRMVAEGRLEGTGLEVTLPEQDLQLAQPTLSWEGRVELTAAGESKGLQVSQEAALAAQDTSVRYGSDSFHQGRLDLKGALDLSVSDAATILSHDGELVLTGIRAQAPDATISEAALRWRGRVQARLVPGAPRTGLKANGTLAGTSLELRLPQRALSAGHAGLAWEGEAELLASAPSGSPRLEGGMRLTRPFLQHTGDAPLRVADAAWLQIDDLASDDQGALLASAVSAEQLRVAAPLAPGGDARSGQGSPPLVGLKRFALSDLRYAAATGLSLERLDLDGLEARLHRAADGGFPLLDRLLAALAPPPSDTALAADAGGDGPRPGLRVGRITLSADSWAAFSDAGTEPAFETRVQVTEATIDALDSTRPDQPSPFRFSGKLGEYSDLALEGEIKPFGPQLAADLKGHIKGVELPPLSPYTLRFLGYQLTNGHLNTDLRLRISEGKLDGSSTLHLSNLDVEPADPDKMGGLTTQLDMPLDAALSLLRDSDNNIELDLPVKGDVRDPQFDISDAINQAMGSAMKMAAVGYLKLALQPFGALITVAQLAGEAGSAVSLDPVRFAHGEAVLAGKSAEYLAQVAKLLRERPGLRLKLCGNAVPEDRRVMAEAAALAAAKTANETKGKQAPTPGPIGDDRLEKLAKARSSAVKALLVQEHGIGPERLFVCHPRLEKEAETKAMVKLMI